MTDYRDAKTLYNEQKGHRKPKNPFKLSHKICEQHELGACKASMEAYKLGLAKAVFACRGIIPPECTIRLKLAAGKTIQELYQNSETKGKPRV